MTRYHVAVAIVPPPNPLARASANCYALRKSEAINDEKTVVFRELFILLLGFLPFMNSLSNRASRDCTYQIGCNSLPFERSGE